MTPNPLIVHQLVALQHTVDQVTERAPIIPAAGQAMLVNEEDVLLEASVEMRLKPELSNDWVVVAVNVGVDSVHALKDLAHKVGERLGERDAWLSQQDV